MARVTVTDEDVRVRFSWWERLGVWRGGLVLPWTDIRSVEVVDRPLAAARGARAGIVVLGLVKVGFWRLGTRSRQLVAVRRAVPAVRIGLDRARQPFGEVLVSTPDATHVALVGARR
jgi:hypothetical protein